MLNKDGMSVSISYVEILNWDWLSESECVIKCVQAKKQGISAFMYSGWKSTGKHSRLRSLFSAQKCQQFQLWKTSPIYISTCPVQCLLEPLQGRWLHHVSGQSVPMLNNSFSEEILQGVQPEQPPMQFEVISSCPVTC